MDAVALPQIAALSRTERDPAGFEAQMAYWDEICESRTARFARWVWRGLAAVATWHPTGEPLGRLVRV